MDLSGIKGHTDDLNASEWSLQRASFFLCCGHMGSGFAVWGLGFRVQGSGCSFFFSAVEMYRFMTQGEPPEHRCERGGPKLRDAFSCVSETWRF